MWLIRGGFPKKTMNVYLIEDDGTVTLFDAGIRGDDEERRDRGRRRSAASAASCSATGTSTTAAPRPASGVPVYCHPDEVDDVEGDGGLHYADISQLETALRARR